MVLSADSAILNQRKPFFLPDWTEDVRYTPSIVLRVSRLGKNIAPKFAYRYYDAVADGAHFIAWDHLNTAIEQGHSWSRAVAFDGSLGLGEWREINPDEPEELPELVTSAADAIAEASRVMTIRQGDLICIHTTNEPIKAERELITKTGNKIK